MRHRLWSAVGAACLVAGLGGPDPVWAQAPGLAPRPPQPRLPAPNRLPTDEANRPELDGPKQVESLLPPAPSIIDPRNVPIDLNTALRLAGVQNPELNLARARVLEAVAERQLALAQVLPTLNPGTNYDTHSGALQQSNGNILTVNRSAVYVGAGTNAVAAGTVNIPGVFLGGNVAQGLFAFLVSRQVVREREFTTLEVRNQVFLQVATAYSELTRAEARRAVEQQAREEARLVARLTAGWAESGEGRIADANRAATDLARRETLFQQAEAQVLVTSARLCQLLNLDPSIRLHPTDAWLVPHQIVPDPIPLCELLAIAMLQRPELAARRTVIRESLLVLEGARLLPFSPTILLGYSAGGFGGGSNLVRPVFGAFGYRTDFDAIGYWTLQNLGVGNLALINIAKARLQQSRFQELEVLNRVRAEVAEAYALTHVRFAQIRTNEQAVHSGARAFREDYDRIRLRAERDVLPIELLDSFHLLARARDNLVDVIAEYNNAQFALYVALGQPPANMLAHPVPVGGVIPAGVQPVTPPPGVPIAPRNLGAPTAATPPTPPSSVPTPRALTVRFDAPTPTRRAR